MVGHSSQQLGLQLVDSGQQRSWVRGLGFRIRGGSIGATWWNEDEKANLST